MKIRKILVAVEFTPGSMQIVEEAVTLAQQVQGDVEIELVHVWSASESIMPSMMLRTDEKGTGKRLLEEARTKNLPLQDAAAFLTDVENKGWTVKARMEHGPAAEAIVKIASDGLFDVIVMGTHGRKGLGHAVLGSVAEKVVRTSGIPVLTLRLRH